MEECKRCLLLESAQVDILKTVQEELRHIPADKKADDVLYQKRLEHCRQCNLLISGTCMKCGCYVELRAAFKNQKCPNTRARKW